jgi:hypothetical protein
VRRSATQNSYEPEQDTQSPPAKRHKRISARERLGLGRPLPRAFPNIRLPLEPDQVRIAEEAVRGRNYEYERQFKKHGFAAVIDLAYKDCMASGHPFSKKKPFNQLAQWRQHGLPLLASSPESLLECFLGEGVAISVSLYEELRDLYDAAEDDPSENSVWIQRYGQAFAPCQYVRELVNKYGEAPTPNEVKEVVQVLRQYVSGDNQYARQNAAVESQSRKVRTTEQDIKDGYHYFLRGDDHRARQILTFCAAVEQRLSEIDEEDYDVTMPWTFKYVGYARKAADRFKSYSADQSQSYLTELVRNAFRHVFPDLGFKIDAHVIYFCTCIEECQLGEELLSRIGQAYLETGTGFGITAAGIAVSSANTSDFNFGQAKQLWDMTMQFRMDSYDFFFENMEREGKRVTEYESYLRALKQTIPATQDVEDNESYKSQLREEIGTLRAELEQVQEGITSSGDSHKKYESLRTAQHNLEQAISTSSQPHLLPVMGGVHKHAAATLATEIDALGTRPEAWISHSLP